MSRISIALALSLIAGPALAEEKTPKVPPPHCEAIETIKAAYRAGAPEAKFTVMTPGQFHFLAGVYAASPITPPGGLPPGDGALMVQTKDRADLFWTRGNKQACITVLVIDAEAHKVAYVPLPIPKTWLPMLESIRTGVGELAPAADTSEDLKL